MAYRVAFDGKTQEKFRKLDEAVDWAREVGETGRIAFVIKGSVRPRLVAVLPPEREAEGRRLWSLDPMRPTKADLAWMILSA